jgi:hypothetical protein
MNHKFAAVGLLVSLVFAVAPRAEARVEFSLGLVDEIEGVQSETATIAWLTEHRMPWEFMLGHIRDRVIDGAEFSPSANFVAVSRQLVWRRWFLSSGIAFTDTDSDNEVLSGSFQFLSGVGWRNERLTISLRHISNANTSGRNRGETFLLFGYRW